MLACSAYPPEPPVLEILAVSEPADASLILREAVHQARALGLGGRARILAPPPTPGLVARADRALLSDACLKLLAHAARRVGFDGMVLPALDGSSAGVAVWIVWDEPSTDPGPLEALVEVRDIARAMGGDLTFSLAGASRALTLRLPAAGVAADAPRPRLQGARIQVIGGDPAEVAYVRRALAAHGAAQDAGPVHAALMFAEVEPACLVGQIRELLANDAPPFVVVAHADRAVDPIQLRALKPTSWLDRPASATQLVSALAQAVWSAR